MLGFTKNYEYYVLDILGLYFSLLQWFSLIPTD